MIVGGRFEVIREAGSGGMGVVYAARDQVTGAKVAVKVLGDRSHAPRFTREAEVLAQLQHPAIVGYVAHAAGTEDAPAWLAMEWLEGEDLATRIERGRLSIDEAITVAARIADAVGAAHARGIVHRDLKPSNVFLVGGRAAEAKLLDFGLARDVSSSASRRPLTATGTVMGSVGYLAPEQARGASTVDARADVFALGCILFECLTGTPAFSGSHAVAILAKLLVEDAPRVRTARPEVAHALDALVARMLEREPDRRPTDGHAARDALLRVSNASSAPRTSVRPSALTREEQRLMAVILVSERRGEQATSDTSTGAATIISLGSPGARAVVSAAIAPFDAALDVAGDGTLVTTLRGGGAGTDQASRAAKCALAIRAACPGPIVALALGRGSSSADGPVAGEVIERAAALLAAAQHDSSDAVHVEASVVPLLEARFITAPGPAGMLLHAERNTLASARVLLGRITPFVGRAREMATLEQVFATAILEREASAGVVIGAAGSGKSRLRDELLRTIERREPGAVVWIAQGDAQRAQSPFGAAAAMVRAACGIEDASAPPEAQRAALAARVAGLDDSERVTCFLAEMISCPIDAHADVPTSPALRRARESALVMQDQITRAWLDFVGAELAKAPLVLVLDDLHWIDTPTVALYGATLAAFREEPLVVVGLGRPEALERFPALWAQHGAQTIQLPPLSPRAAEKLVRQALTTGSASLDDAFVARMVERAEGNPFLLEELVRASAESPKTDDALPAGVLGLVQARLEALDPSLRRVLRAASIFGRTAREGGIARLLGDESAIELVRSSLRVLVQREVLEFVSDDPTLLRFRHDLVRDAAYEMLTAADRAVGHGLAGAWLEESGEHDASVLALHYDLAGDAGRAATSFVRAAEQALEGNAARTAAAHATRAIDLGVTGEPRGRALYARAMATQQHGDCGAAFEDAYAALAELRPGSATWYAVVFHACTLGDVAGQRDVVHRLVTSALAVEPEDDRARAMGLRVLGDAATFRFHAGDRAGAKRLIDRFEVEAAPFAADPLVALAAHRLRATHCAYGDDPFGEMGAWAAIREIEGTLGNRRACAVADINMGYGWMMLGEYERAEASLCEGIALAQTLQFDRAAAAARHNLGMVLARRGDLEEAVRQETLAIDAMLVVRDNRLIGTSRMYLAMIHEMKGDLGAAEACARQALREVEGQPPLRANVMAALAHIVLSAGHLEEARELAERIAVAQRTSHVEGGRVYPNLVYAEVLLAAGEVEEAKATLRDVKRMIEVAAARIPDDRVRESFLTRVPENARALALEHQLQ